MMCLVPGLRAYTRVWDEYRYEYASGVNMTSGSGTARLGAHGRGQLEWWDGRQAMLLG